MSAPPAAETLLGGFLADPDLREAVLGDLAEAWSERADDDGARAANVWYREQALRTAPHLFAAWWRGAAADELRRTLGRVALVLAGAGLLAALTFVGLSIAAEGHFVWPPGASRDAVALWMILAGSGWALAGGLAVAARSPGAPMAATLLLALGWIPLTLVLAAAFPAPPGPPPWLLLAFPATLTLATVVGGAAATLLGWPDRARAPSPATGPSTMEEAMKTENTAWRLAARPLLAAAVLLAVPLVAMQLTDEVVWTLADFAIMGALVVGTGVLYELASMKAGSAAYRLAAAVALGAAFLLVWVTLAVGIIGASGDPADLMYGGVLAVGAVGALLARFRPLGMARAMFAMAAAQASTAAVALLAGWVPAYNPAFEILGINGMFAALFVGSGLLFLRAAEGPSAASTVEA